MFYDWHIDYNRIYKYDDAAWIKTERLIAKSTIQHEITHDREEEATETSTDEIIERQKLWAFGKFRMTSLKSIIEWNKMKSGLKTRGRKRRERRTYEFKDGSARSRQIDANPTCRDYPTADAGEKRVLQLICNAIQMVRASSEFVPARH